MDGRGGWLAVALALPIIGSLGGCIVEEKCNADAECGAGRICVDGECRAGCRLSRDCPDGQRCIANRCEPEGGDGDADTDADRDCAVDCPEDMVAVCGYCVDLHEASRQDATAGSAGADDLSAATSRAGVVPWTSMTREQAAAACERAGKRLCTHLEWIDACQGPDRTVYPYGDLYEPETCNGIDTYGRGNQRLMPTGSFPGCVNEYGAFDLSGNVWEIDADVPGWVHGGAYNCIDSESLHMCSYNQNFGTGPLPNVGFRCCADGVP